MGAPGGEFAAEEVGVGGEDPFVVGPGFGLEVEEDDVGSGAAVDWVAEGGFVCDAG